MGRKTDCRPFILRLIFLSDGAAPLGYRVDRNADQDDFGADLIGRVFHVIFPIKVIGFEQLSLRTQLP
jgi:hypothetical protein